MNKKIMFLMCLLMAMVWTAGCSCPAVRPVAAAPRPRGGTRRPRLPPPPAVVKPAPVEEPAPSKKLKKRVIKGTGLGNLNNQLDSLRRESRLKKLMAEWTGPGRSFVLICGKVN